MLLMLDGLIEKCRCCEGTGLERVDTAGWGKCVQCGSPVPVPNEDETGLLACGHPIRYFNEDSECPRCRGQGNVLTEAGRKLAEILQLALDTHQVIIR